MRFFPCFLLALVLSLPVPGMKPIPEDNRMQPDQFPTPFSAAELREACPPGRFSVYRVETTDGSAYRQLSEFTEETGEKAHFRGWRESIAGEPEGEITTAAAAWTELQAHAAFPAAATSVTEGTVTVPAGSWTCWIYRVEQGGMVNELAFAQDLPGPPVRMRVLKDGKVVYAMMLLEDRIREPSEAAPLPDPAP